MFEFTTDDVKNHKMQAKKAAPAFTLKLVTEDIIEVNLELLFFETIELTYLAASHGQIFSLAGGNKLCSQTEHNPALARQSFLGDS